MQVGVLDAIAYRLAHETCPIKAHQLCWRQLRIVLSDIKAGASRAMVMEGSECDSGGNITGSDPEMTRKSPYRGAQTFVFVVRPDMEVG